MEYFSYFSYFSCVIFKMLFFVFLAAARKIARLPEKNILPDSGGLQPHQPPPALTPMVVTSRPERRLHPGLTRSSPLPMTRRINVCMSTTVERKGTETETEKGRWIYMRTHTRLTALFPELPSRPVFDHGTCIHTHTHTHTHTHV